MRKISRAMDNIFITAINTNKYIDGHGLTSAESRAIGNYRKTSHHYMNAMLRGEQPEHSKVRADVNKLDSALSKNYTTQDLTLHRGMGKILNNLKEGDVVHHKGFSSTSLNPEGPAMGYSGGTGKYVSFHYPQGSPAVAGNAEDDELILPRNLSLQITKIHPDHYEAQLHSSHQQFEASYKKHAVGNAGVFPGNASFVFRPAHHNHEDHQLHVHVPEKNGPIGSLHWDGKDGNISGVDVHPDYRRRGIATHLYTKADQLAKEYGFSAPSGTPFQTPDGQAFRTNFDQLKVKPDISRIPTTIDPGKGADKTDLAQHMIEDHSLANSQDYVKSMKPKDLDKWHNTLTQYDSCGWQR